MTCSVLVGLHSQIFQDATQRVSSEFQITSLPLRDAAPADFQLYLPLTLADYAELRTGPGVNFLPKAVVPSEDAVATCDDKLTFVEAIRAAGLAPYVPRCLDAPVAYPYVLKKRRGDFGRGTIAVIDQIGHEEADRTFSAIDYFWQELILGDVEYATHVLMHAGQIAYHFTTVFKMGSQSIIKGINANGKYAGHKDAAAFIDLFQDMLNVVGFSDGVCCSTLYRPSPTTPNPNNPIDNRLCVSINAVVLVDHFQVPR